MANIPEKFFIGIDPGKSGAMAIIGEDLRKKISGISVYDFEGGEAMAALFNCCLWPSYAVIEKVHAMPGQGVTSMFNFGMNFGIWQGRFEALGIPYDFVTPQSWKKRIYDVTPARGTRKKSDYDKEMKQYSIDRAKRLFPQTANRLTRKKDHNRAEALLIAEYCRLMKGG